MSDNTKHCKSCGRTYEQENDFINETSQWRKCSGGNLWFNCNCGSTLMIPKGKFDWYKPEARLSPAAKGVFNKIGSIEQLPYISTSIMQLQTLLQDDNTENSTLARTAKREPLLASEIISLSNRLKSSRNPDSLEIKSIEHAISYIGRKELKEYALAIAIKTFKLDTKVFNSTKFWETSFLRGAVAEQLIKDLSLPIEKDQAYLAGTLCNLGKIFGAILFPESMDKVQAQLNSPSTMTTWKNAEAKFPEINHTILGEIGSALWGLPDYILRASRFHHRSTAKKGSLKGTDCIEEICGLAVILTHWISLEPSRIDPDHLSNLCEGFGVTEKDIELLAQRYNGLKYLKIDFSM